MLVTWLAAAMLLGYVGLASMIAAASLPVAIASTHIEPNSPLLTFGVAAVAMIVFTHRKNIVRMQAGTEPRARRLWLFGKRRT
jgi:glycerol-3-phosphate acyltransferase PlsY